MFKMTVANIKRAFWLSLILVIISSAGLVLFYLATISGYLPIGVARFLGLLWTATLGLGFFVFIFGVLMPILGRFVFENILNEKYQKRLLRFWIWRWMLNVSGKGEEKPDGN